MKLFTSIHRFQRKLVISFWWHVLMLNIRIICCLNESDDILRMIWDLKVDDVNRTLWGNEECATAEPFRIRLEKHDKQRHPKTQYSVECDVQERITCQHLQGNLFHIQFISGGRLSLRQKTLAPLTNYNTNLWDTQTYSQKIIATNHEWWDIAFR